MSRRALDRSLWFLRETWQRAVAGRSVQLASALAYTSILTVVPLLVGFATLSLFPALATCKAPCRASSSIVSCPAWGTSCRAT